MGVKVIGLTGGIASGKSSVSLYLSALGATVIDADAVSASVLEAQKQQLPEIFGALALDNDVINKVYIRQEIFKHPEKKQQLEQLVHGKVKEAIEKLIADLDETVPLVVVEVPLLFEAGWEAMFDEIWTIAVDKEVRLQRLLRRSGMNKTLAMNIMAQQWSDEARAKHAHVVIENEGDLAALRVALDALYHPYQT